MAEARTYQINLLCARRSQIRNQLVMCSQIHEFGAFAARRTDAVQSTREDVMIDVYNDETDELIGSITEADLKVLVDGLEEESEDDQDYYINQATIDVLGDGRATEHLLGVLRKALGSAEGVEIRWERR
jgi:hypothetical protein